MRFLPLRYVSLLIAASFASVAVPLGCSSRASDPTPPVVLGPEPMPDPGNQVPGPTMAQSSLTRTPAADVPQASLAAAVAANNAFAVDLYGHVRGALKGANVLTAPITASLALTMTYAGADDATATQMATALHVTDPSTIFEGQNALTTALSARAANALAAAQARAGSAGPAPDPADYQLQVVSTLFGEQDYTWGPTFLDTLARNYGAGVHLEDFRQHYDGARQDINGWVSETTSGKITDLLPAGTLDETTRLVLVDAIHVKLPWDEKFEASQTRPGTFTRADGSTVSPDFLRATRDLSYADDGQAQIVSLPLAGRELALVVALPHGDLATYEAGLTAASLAMPASTSSVDLALPKFDFTTDTFSLKDGLKAMGLVDAFDSTLAKFRTMCPQPNEPRPGALYVANVLQKAEMAVQETGVEAAGATAVIVSFDAGLAMEAAAPIPMVVDRPFVVALVDVPTGAVLFLGHVGDPTATSP